MSDFDPVPQYDVFPAPVDLPQVAPEAPAEVVDAAPSSTEPPVVEVVEEVPAAVPAETPVKDPPLRMTPEGVVLSKVVVSAEGVILKVED